MLDDDELRALADDILELGQHHPIVLDADGRILDGRNRLKACEIAGVEPVYVTYEGTARAPMPCRSTAATAT
ncbi:ParB N-terminal domain-containing protein [Streptomyces sp. NBC_01439]|uniref:ParB N-terminal domain-containing protein n=1 Tax=Streptomyces sp. NBC_01439 TaxID=2903867 RepID=UPI002E2E0F3C|nr:ParB N-terminal domain-containing protein [Streptomyces sp. NBC_01439]